MLKLPILTLYMSLVMFISFESLILVIKGKEKAIGNLYWKIYGTSHITNNELYLWLGKSWIAETKGHLVNWVETIVVPAQETAQCMNIGSLLKGHCTNSSKCSDRSKRQGVTSQNHKNLDSNAFISKDQNLIIVPATMEEIRDVDKLLDFKHDMRK